ncbi:hypothetical protein EVAR_11170_1 [Eumeta japonica]|uniref:Uncharacterized protein n=1 Tax=Eumeta variegata TaxID=151549 RepID=A0A4C1U4B8_EUMVA|nr:hypothetical protein EVAR_11170_1 [Eumeta japonica]
MIPKSKDSLLGVFPFEKLPNDGSTHDNYFEGLKKQLPQTLNYVKGLFNKRAYSFLKSGDAPVMRLGLQVSVGGGRRSWNRSQKSIYKIVKSVTLHAEKLHDSASCGRRAVRRTKLCAMRRFSAPEPFTFSPPCFYFTPLRCFRDNFTAAEFLPPNGAYRELSSHIDRATHRRAACRSLRSTSLERTIRFRSREMPARPELNLSSQLSPASRVLYAV